MFYTVVSAAISFPLFHLRVCFNGRCGVKQEYVTSFRDNELAQRICAVLNKGMI